MIKHQESNFTKNTQLILGSNIYLAAHLPLMMNQRIIMQKSVAVLTFLFIFCTAKAQYYYTDIVDLKASNNIYLNLKKNNVHEVSATSLKATTHLRRDLYFQKS
jgi:hypothetical protein